METTLEVNTTLLRKLVDAHGDHAVSKVVVDSDVCHSTVQEALRGIVCGSRSRNKLANYFGVDVALLFPAVVSEQMAA